MSERWCIGIVAARACAGLAAKALDVETPVV
jgi:hypothetical protein